MFERVPAALERKEYLFGGTWVLVSNILILPSAPPRVGGFLSLFDHFTSKKEWAFGAF